jgi:hypothetical protein
VGSFAGADVCWEGCGGAAGAFAEASSKAAKGCESLSWLGVDACVRDDSETVAEASDAILGTLGTGDPWKRHRVRVMVCLQPAGQDVPVDKLFRINGLCLLGSGWARQSLRPGRQFLPRRMGIPADMAAVAE